MNKIKNKQIGSMLIEAILALAITIVIITGIVSALIASLSNSTFSKNQNRASGFSQEGLEVARNLKDSNYDEFALLSGYYCLDKGATVINERAGGSKSCGKNMGDLISSREIFISVNGNDTRNGQNIVRCQASNSIFVASTVYWNDSKCSSGADLCHKVELNSCFVDLHNVDSI